MKKRKKLIAKSVAVNIFFIALCFITLIPVLYVLAVSFGKNDSLVSSGSGLLPQGFTFDNYIAVFREKPVLTWFGNTVLLAVCTVIISLVVSIPAAYAFSRMRFTGKKHILRLIIILNAFPQILSMFAIYRLLSPLGLINTHAGLIMVYTGTMAIFGLWNMKGYFDTVPVEIEEAARIDGATQRQVITKILMPLAKPSIIVTGVMVLIYVWNEYIYATTFMTGADKYTLAAGLSSLQAGEMSGNWPKFAAASLIVSLPVLIIFLAVQRNMVSGLSAGGVKG